MGNVDAVLQSYDDRPELLIPLLQKVQEAEGYISEEAVDAISRKLRVARSEVFGTLTFYAQFRLTPVGENLVRVCLGTACHVRGASRILSAVRDEVGLAEGQETSDDGMFTVERIACFGACSLAPVMVVNEDIYGSMTPDKARDLVRRRRKECEAANNGGE